MNESKYSDQSQPPPQSAYILYSEGSKEQFDLVDLLVELWARRLLVMSVAFTVSVLSVMYALLATPIYRAEVLLAPVRSDEGANLPAGVGQLASLAGVNLGNRDELGEAIATLRSRILVEEFIQENELLPVLYPDEWDEEESRWISDDPENWPELQDGIRLFIEDIRSVEEDPDSILVALTVEWSNAELAAQWASELVARTNERLRARALSESQQRLRYLNEQLENVGLIELRQAISRLIERQVETIMLAQVDTEYAFRVIDPPRVPNEHAYPRRILVVGLGIIVGGMLGILSALFSWTIVRRRSASDK